MGPWGHILTFSRFDPIKIRIFYAGFESGIGSSQESIQDPFTPKILFMIFSISFFLFDPESILDYLYIYFLKKNMENLKYI